jgi:EKC/KEOPS complex subunit CGI121/TPRKB
VTDVKALRKVYKLDSGNGGGGGGGKKGRKGKAEEVVVNGNGLSFGKDEKAEMESVILGIMALKGT